MTSVRHWGRGYGPDRSLLQACAEMPWSRGIWARAIQGRDLGETGKTGQVGSLVARSDVRLLEVRGREAQGGVLRGSTVQNASVESSAGLQGWTCPCRRANTYNSGQDRDDPSCGRLALACLRGFGALCLAQLDVEQRRRLSFTAPVKCDKPPSLCPVGGIEGRPHPGDPCCGGRVSWSVRVEQEVGSLDNTEDCQWVGACCRVPFLCFGLRALTLFVCWRCCCRTGAANAVSGGAGVERSSRWALRHGASAGMGAPGADHHRAQDGQG
ncbi:hypothetical protein B0T11DRAFT_122397 [Plectosphaerella cucumerina]|uniref:Uncharacterized protein n=1 Tax=Plectosphaerella cucumerina TaxID=40658 RepID=A0A8K0X0F9_9PEZI|nr:hypothetical protein B0T11DRAFT_122397 [Plectosphaerella cucumerina]